MLVRWGIRVGTSLVGIAVGILVSSAVLSKFSIDATAVVEATLIFWAVHLVVQLLALRVLVHEPSIALAGLLALASTIVALIIVNAIVSGLTNSWRSDVRLRDVDYLGRDVDQRHDRSSHDQSAAPMSDEGAEGKLVST